MPKTVAVIGAGTAGICAGRHLLAAGFEVTIFEQASEVGGTWVFNENIGKDKYGIDVHSSMYKGLHTNLPKEIMGYPDFPIPDQEKSYIPAEDMLNFLKTYANHFGVTPTIKFEHYVVRIRPKGELNQRWEIIVKNLPKDKMETHMFDAVMICNGHYHTPAFPDYKGQDIYNGQLLHSHDYRCPDSFKGEILDD
jgi:dimethylaniline monooxygenase (N-oxide forming)